MGYKAREEKRTTMNYIRFITLHSSLLGNIGMVLHRKKQPRFMLQR
jgi:hypothetical protein